MKNIFTIALAAFLSFSAMAQTLTGGCDSVYVTSTPPPEQNVYFVNVYYKQCGGPDACCRTITSGSPATPRFFLEQKQDNGSWSQIGGQQYSPLFDNLGYGTYRVRMNMPVVNWNHCGGGIPTTCYNTLGQFIGYWGMWDAQDIYTNEAIVGNTVPSDNSYFFTEGNPSGSPISMDLDEDVGMDASASTNYDQWYLAICENSFNDCFRYKPNGWTNGTVGPFDLKAFWALGNGWQFVPWNSYEVQFVVENSKCRNGVEAPPPWNVNYQSFLICPAGTGCRFKTGDREITLSPNPASSFIRLGNFDPAVDTNYEMSFSDLSGKAVKSLPLTSDQVHFRPPRRDVHRERPPKGTPDFHRQTCRQQLLTKKPTCPTQVGWAFLSFL